MAHWINNISSMWVDFVLLMTVQNCLFLLFIFFLLYLFRNKDARILRGIAVIGLVKLFIPPFLPVSISSAELYTASYLSLFVVTGTPESIVEPAKSISLSLSSIAMLGWLLLVIVLVAIVIGYMLRMRIIIKHARPITLKIEIPDTRHKIDFLISEEAKSPFVYGFFHHRVILPCSWDSWSVDCQKAVIAHEIAHICHYDHWISFFQVLAQLVHFYNPLTWIHYKKLRHYNEIACDDSAAKAIKLSPLRYSHFLVSIAEKLSKPRRELFPLPSLSASQESLMKRVIYQLTKNSERSLGKMTLKSRAILFVTILMILPFSWYCTLESLLTPVIPAQPDVENIGMEGSKYDIPDFLPIKDQPRAIGGFSAIQDRVKYPEAARNAGVQGQVVINVLVNEEGDPIEFKVLRSLAGYGLEEAAIAAISQTKFTSALQNSVPVKFWVSIPVKFRLNSESTDTQVKDLTKVQGIFIRESDEKSSSGKATDTMIDKNNIADFLALESQPRPIGGVVGIQRKIRFPENTLIEEIQGLIVIQVLIDENGNPVDFKVLKSLGRSDLDASAIEAIRQVKFTPPNQNGVPVKFWMSIPINFQMKGD